MKKNVMMRVASIMLVLVLMSSSVISGTFAKYVTADNGGDSARVAKFGVVVDVEGSMFAKAYLYDDVVETSVSGNTSVLTQNNGKVVAPGTAGGMVDIEITGKPEVDVEVSYKATVDFSGWEVSDDTFYCPLILTINGNDYYLNDYADAAAAKTAIEGIINTYSTTYDAGTVLDTAAGYLDISWSWPYETGADDVEIAANDKRDTELGMFNTFADASTISIDVICTVTQID